MNKEEKEKTICREAERQYKQVWDTIEANDRKIEIIISAMIIFITQILLSDITKDILKGNNCFRLFLFLLLVIIITYGIIRGLIAYCPTDIARGPKIQWLVNERQGNIVRSVINNFKDSIEKNKNVSKRKTKAINNMLWSFFISFIITIITVYIGG